MEHLITIQKTTVQQYLQEEKIENKPRFIRIKHLSFKIFNKSYWVGIGTPIIVRYISLGWKDKYGTPRCEWQPFLTIYFF